MYTHYWYTRDAGMAIECDKCGKYVNLWYGNDYDFDEKKEDCPISDEEFKNEISRNVIKE